MRRVSGLVIALFLMVVGGVASPAIAAAPQIRVLSNRADLISGGDALVEVRNGASVSINATGAPGGLTIKLNGSDVTDVFGMSADGRLMGLLKNLSMGENVVTASAPGGKPVALTIVNHPIGGPVLSGPQIQPWSCFAGAVDKQCNRPPVISYLYKPSSGGPLAAYDPENPPSDVATTTTDQGKTVPFIVRQEVGAIDRDEYRIALLYDPSKPWSPLAPQDGFNHKLVIFHGASCDTAYEQAAAPETSSTRRRWARASRPCRTRSNNAGHNCNIVTQAESMIMTKEHLIETYGTIATRSAPGCSGGSLVQQQVANAFPGLYQGITPQCSFTDAWSSAMQYEDYVMMRRYLEHPEDGGRASSGLPHAGPGDRGAHQPGERDHVHRGDPQQRRIRPAPARASREDQVFDQDTNPKGVRCTLQDYMVNVFGRRAQDGYAQRPFDNVGIQYGLKALLAGTISPAQFVDLNAKIGAVDMNFNPTTERAEADRPALERVYRSGAVEPGRQPRQGRDHRPARARSGRVPRRLPHVRDARPARPRARHTLPTRCCGAGSCRCSATRTTSTRRSSRWTSGWRSSRRTRATSRSPRRSSRTSPTSVTDRCTERHGDRPAGQRLRRVRARRTRTRASRLGCRWPTTR